MFLCLKKVLATREVTLFNTSLTKYICTTKHIVEDTCANFQKKKKNQIPGNFSPWVPVKNDVII